jgi:hypothetical protein
MDSKVNIPAKSGEGEACNLANSGDPTSPILATYLANSGGVTSPNLATEQLREQLNKQKKETGDSFPNDKPIERKEDATALFQKAREFWNEKGLKPECRDIIIKPIDVSEILRTFQHYSWEEIRNAIGNFHWHKIRAGPGYVDPPPYGSLAGFLKTGVERYFDDDALDQQFKKDGKN